MPRATHRGTGGNKRPDPCKCARGHDLTDPDNAYTDPTGVVHCRRCRAEREQRTAEIKRAAGVQRNYRFESCAECGKDKYPDRRRLCFACAHQKAMDNPVRVEAQLQRAVDAEILMPWDRGKPPS